MQASFSCFENFYENEKNLTKKQSLTVIISLYFNETKRNQNVLFTLLLQNIDEYSSIKVMKHTLSDKLRNAESPPPPPHPTPPHPPRKKSQQFESSSTNIPIVGEDLLRVFYKQFYLQFCDSSDQWKKGEKAVLLAIWEIFLHQNNCN